MNYYLQKIEEMHKKFGISNKDVGFTEEEKDFRITAIDEELTEYSEAENRVDELDALVDLLIFTLGTVERMGLSNVFDEAFNRVMKANMTKEIGPLQKRNN